MKKMLLHFFNSFVSWLISIQEFSHILPSIKGDDDDDDRKDKHYMFVLDFISIGILSKHQPLLCLLFFVSFRFFSVNCLF